ncbi:MAG: tRNA (adenosine(37)-N6)-dimethylallyltransferase MiaA [Bacilli bacterium]|nr:tRNA (adenosine(37)-N6)-dimethylallyltransferase MiaA [Bacilli bacterium]
MKNIIVITGPTGVGKTKMSIELAKRIDAEIINADSMQVYKDLNIGTAKITEKEKEGIPHHLFDIVEPTNMYTVYDYQKDARDIINDVLSRGKKVIIVGGTGLYIKALLYDYKFIKEDKTYDFSKMSNEEILDKINSYNLDINLHINNRKRLERVLTKLYNNNMQTEKTDTVLYDFVAIGLTTTRDNLYKIIDNRVDKMIEDGLIDEVEELYKKNIHSKAINTGIGYKELYKYFDKEISLDEAISLIKKNSRHYAKRQYTFFNNQMNIKWFNTNYEDFSLTVEEVYNYIKGE